ncbi:MAG TPA: HAMP domain-containing methyl-accepting chemotaxis protein, partial [Patescibacteria group bacterium]|nr:HAMP domain-containing methyl-accepting chemotaxis protein [Patescibacteria group bacterium]
MKLKSLRIENIKIGMKYTAAMAIAILMFLSSTFIIYMLIQASKNDFNVIEQANNNTVEITKIISGLDEEDVMITDFILFQTPSLKNELVQTNDKIVASLDNISLEVNEAAEAIEHIKSNINEMQNIFINDIIPAVERNDRSKYILARRKAMDYAAKCKEDLQGIQGLLEVNRTMAMANSIRQLDNTIAILLVSIGVSAALGLACMYGVSRMINRHLNRVVFLSKEVAKGNLAVDKVNYLGSDEIGQLSQSFDVMTDSLRNIIGQIVNASTKVSRQSAELTDSAAQLKQGIEQVAVTMEQLAVGVGEQADSTSKIVSVTEGLNNQIIKANGQSELLEEEAKNLQDMADKGYALMENSIEQMGNIHGVVKSSAEQMGELDEKAQKISQLVEIIHDISEQTNLLALNAAIEAARAGESGRGFAVVANEIKKLSEQVGNSVKEITSIVIGIKEQSKTAAVVLQKGYGLVEEGTRQIRMTGETFHNMKTEVASIVERISSVGVNMIEIADNSEKINSSIEQIAAISEETAAGVQETSASIQQQNSCLEIIQDNAQMLSELAFDLKDTVAKFS